MVLSQYYHAINVKWNKYIYQGNFEYVIFEDELQKYTGYLDFQLTNTLHTLATRVTNALCPHSGSDGIALSFA